MSASHPARLILDVWSRAADSYPAYSPVLPGDPQFICQPAACDAWCCRNLTVPVGESDAARLVAVTGRSLGDLVESEAGSPILLPLADPYVLTREGGHCAHLGPGLGCSLYEGRPSACRLYPHQVILLDPETARPSSAVDPAACVESLLAGAALDVVPILVRHLPCPGFTAAPLSDGAWAALLRETVALQFSAR